MKPTDVYMKAMEEEEELVQEWNTDLKIALLSNYSDMSPMDLGLAHEEDLALAPPEEGAHALSPLPPPSPQYTNEKLAMMENAASRKRKREREKKCEDNSRNIYWTMHRILRDDYEIQRIAQELEEAESALCAMRCIVWDLHCAMKRNEMVISHLSEPIRETLGEWQREIVEVMKCDMVNDKACYYYIRIDERTMTEVVQKLRTALTDAMCEPVDRVRRLLAGGGEEQWCGPWWVRSPSL